MNLGVPLGLSSGLCWGAADFFGGIQSRRLPALTVAFWSQAAGAVALAAALLVLVVDLAALLFAADTRPGLQHSARWWNRRPTS